MSLRFAIIKTIKTAMGKQWEDVVYELQEDHLVNSLEEKMLARLEKLKQDGRFREAKYNKHEIKAILRIAFEDTVREFKKITLRIL